MLNCGSHRQPEYPEARCACELVQGLVRGRCQGAFSKPLLIRSRASADYACSGLLSWLRDGTCFGSGRNQLFFLVTIRITCSSIHRVRKTRIIERSTEKAVIAASAGFVAPSRSNIKARRVRSVEAPSQRVDDFKTAQRSSLRSDSRRSCRDASGHTVSRIDSTVIANPSRVPSIPASVPYRSARFSCTQRPNTASPPNRTSQA